MSWPAEVLAKVEKKVREPPRELAAWDLDSSVLPSVLPSVMGLARNDNQCFVMLGLERHKLINNIN